MIKAINIAINNSNVITIEIMLNNNVVIVFQNDAKLKITNIN
jgi:hypothetical protein